MHFGHQSVRVSFSARHVTLLPAAVGAACAGGVPRRVLSG
jgi:hypothetical protein